MYSSLWLFCLIIIYIYCFPYLIKGNNETDRMALLNMKAKIISDPLGVMGSWNNTIHYCEWYGVTCSHKNQRVISLDLHSSKLTGTISPYLGNLSFLVGLYLENNHFTGTIPPEIGRLHKLRIIELRNNSIGGEIPSNISNCYSLKSILLKNNNLMGGITPELGSLSQLQELSLSLNNLSGYIPSSLSNLSALSKLGFATNNLTGEIPSWLGKLKSLTILTLDVNLFFGVVPPSIFNLSLLSVLDLGRNDLEGSLPSNLGNTLPQLQIFSLNYNHFTGLIPSSLSNSSNLQVLQLGGNCFHGQVPPLHNSLRLFHISLNDNFFGYGQTNDMIFFSSLANSTNLHEFIIAKNYFEGACLNMLCNCSSLTFINVNYNKLAGDIPTCLENLLSLQTFSCSYNNFSGIIPQGIGKLVNLTRLYLDDNQLSGVIPPSIGNITKLSSLYLSNNSLQGNIPSTIHNCMFLLELSLCNNNLSGKIPAQLFSLPVLFMLDLSNNSLIGSLPREIGQLNHLDVLRISDNMLSGKIPSSLGMCVSLEFLYMGGNSFQGTIPSSLQALKALLYLNLSYNKMSGEIPKFLASITLQRLDLSHNNFDGEVPIGGIFSNSTSVLVTGNNKLCGGIPDLSLPKCKSTKNKQINQKYLMIAILSGLVGVVFLAVLLMALYFFIKRKRTNHLAPASDSENFPQLSYRALLIATNGFSIENLIGSGTFGLVYKGNLENNGQTVAIKVFNLESHGALKSFMIECGILRKIKHRNLVKVITTCSGIDYQGRDFKALVYEYMKNGSLEDLLHSTEACNRDESARKLSFNHRLNIAVDVAYSLDYLHCHCGTSIVHCDVKPSNILLDEEMVAHVSDFGIAKFLPRGIDSSQVYQSSSIGIRGTIGYTPPEYGLGNEVSTSGDVYSYGILLLEIFTGKRPTNDMFKGDLNLRAFVKEAFPDNVMKVIDPVLLEYIDEQEMSQSSILEILTCILDIALCCTTDVPTERLDMNDVVAKLSSTRNKLLRTRLQQRRRTRAGM